MADEIKSLGFKSIELNFALTETQVEEFGRLKDSGYITISSTHNFCPLPDGVKPKDASPEYYSLSSLDTEERTRAVHYTKKSMDFVKRLGAQALVVHLGRVEVEDRTKRLFVLRGEKAFRAAKEAMLRERAEKAKPFVDAALESLGELLEYADRIDVNIALENRYYIKELPSLEELIMILDKFESKHLFYWHDTGHAMIYENLAIVKYEEYLEALASRLIGVHLHDIILFDDHRAPGCGEFDFRRLRPYLKDETIRVIETHRQATAEEVRASVAYMRKALES